MNDKIPFAIWMELINYLDFKTLIFLRRNFPKLLFFHDYKF